MSGNQDAELQGGWAVIQLHSVARADEKEEYLKPGSTQSLRASTQQCVQRSGPANVPARQARGPADRAHESPPWLPTCAARDHEPQRQNQRCDGEPTSKPPKLRMDEQWSQSQHLDAASLGLRRVATV